MSRRFAFVVAVLAVAAVVAALVLLWPTTAPTTGSSPPSAIKSGLDPLVEEFRATERRAVQQFNDALRTQREGTIDELELSNKIERDVLEPWRALRTRVSNAPSQGELYSTLRLYLEARQLSWEAYVAALRAPGDEAARPHYEAHRAKNAEAQEHAKHLGQLFRAAAEPPSSP